MKKLFILIVLLSGTFIKAKAQEYSRAAFSIGPEMGLPQNSVYNFGYGASAKIEIPVINKFSLSLTGGFSAFNHKGALVDAFGFDAKSKFIPLKAGVRYGTGGGLYLEGEMGDVLETTGNKARLFAFSLGPGFLLRLSDKQAVDIGIRYESWAQHTLTQTGLRVAYRLGW